VLKIDEAIHQQGQYIKDLYNYIDNNGDEKISFQEFKSTNQNKISPPLISRSWIIYERGILSCFFAQKKIGLFDNLKLEIEDDHLKQLFHDIDIDSNNYIEYNELMNYIR